MHAIETSNLKKKFGKPGHVTWALKGVNLRVRKGEIFGLLGPNGAGKTTTIYILSTLLTPTSGTAKVLGLDAARDYRELRERIGFAFSGARFYWDLTAKEILEYYGRLYGLDAARRKRNIIDLITRLGMRKFRNRKFFALSTGMRQKLALAKALINEPEVLFLDEPTSGLDVEVAVKIREAIVNLLQERDMTVILTSHQLYEVEEMCKRIAIMKKGRVISTGPVKAIRKRMGFPDTIRLYLNRYDKLDFLERIRGVLYWDIGDGLVIDAVSGHRVLPEILSTLKKHGVKVRDMEVRKSSLEDMFLKIVRG